MRIVSYMHNGREAVGVHVEDKIVPVRDLLGAQEGAYPVTIGELIADPGIVAKIQTALLAERGLVAALEENQVTYLPAVTHPGKIICIGLNYRKHALETKADIPTSPVVFSKFSDAMAAHEEKIPLPPGSKQVDYEGELGIVIGRRTYQVTQEEALQYVFGYAIANDLSARDLQKRTSQWLLGKTCPKFAPFGPHVVTADEIENPNNLSIKTFVNGVKKQDSSTSDMIFGCAEIIAYVSQYLVLEPGDLILTGTPEGVILGQPVDQRVWLKPGDEVRIEIENIGVLVNTLV